MGALLILGNKSPIGLLYNIVAALSSSFPISVIKLD